MIQTLRLRVGLCISGALNDANLKIRYVPKSIESVPYYAPLEHRMTQTLLLRTTLCLSRSPYYPVTSNEV